MIEDINIIIFNNFIFIKFQHFTTSGVADRVAVKEIIVAAADNSKCKATGAGAVIKEKVKKEASEKVIGEVSQTETDMEVATVTKGHLEYISM